MLTSRRSILQLLGLAGAAYFAPSLAGRSVARAAGGVPRRILFFYGFQGTIPNLWRPTGTENNWQLGTLHVGQGAEDTGLQNYKANLLPIEGLSADRASEAGAGGADGHKGAQSIALSGFGRQSGTRAGGISIDQFIAKELAKAGTVRPIESLILGVGDNDFNGDEGSSTYSGAGSQLRFETNAAKIFGSTPFKNIPATPNTGPDPAALKELARQKSVLDRVTKEFAAASAAASGADRERLQMHADAVRDLEKRMAAAGGGSAACKPPNAQVERSWLGTLDAQYRVIQTAFACDLTRVATLYVEAPEDGGLYGLPGVSAQTFHEAHVHTANPTTVPRYHRFISKQFAKLLGTLAAVKEPDGSTLLDNTIVFWCNQLGVGATHEMYAMPYMLAGGKSSGFTPGRYLRFPGRAHSDLFTNLANMMGVQTAKYGNPSLTAGPLPGL